MCVDFQGSEELRLNILRGHTICASLMAGFDNLFLLSELFFDNKNRFLEFKETTEMTWVKDSLARFGIVEKDGDGEVDKTETSTSKQVANAQIVLAAKADTEKISALKVLVYSTSSGIAVFIKSAEAMRKVFPDDPNACLKAAMVASNMEAPHLVKEIDEMVLVALAKARKAAEEEQVRFMEETSGGLRKEMAAIDKSVDQKTEEIGRLQREIAECQKKKNRLHEQAVSTEATIKEQEAVAQASFAAVEQEIASLRQTLIGL